MLAALATAAMGGWSMVVLRKWNARRARAHREALERGSDSTVNALQINGLVADLGRGAALTALALLVLTPIMRAAAGRWGLDGQASTAIVVGTASAIAVAAVWRLFHGIPGARWLFGAGLVAGLAFLTWR